MLVKKIVPQADCCVLIISAVLQWSLRCQLVNENQFYSFLLLLTGKLTSFRQALKSVFLSQSISICHTSVLPDLEWI